LDAGRSILSVGHEPPLFGVLGYLPGAFIKINISLTHPNDGLHRPKFFIAARVPLVDHLESGIWEVRSRFGTRIARVLFALDGDTKVLLL
jgi:hypothetical protein